MLLSIVGLKDKGVTCIEKLKRDQVIDLAIQDLKKFRISGEFSSDHLLLYAIDQNIEFFDAIRSLPRYIYWLITKYPKIDGSRVLELADFNLRDGEWENLLLRQLLWLEKKEKIDVIGPLREQLFEEITKISVNNGNRRIVVMSVGCGGMETELRVANKVKENLPGQKITFIGIDLSLEAFKVAKQNLSEYEDSFSQLDNLSSEVINEIRNESSLKQIEFKFFHGNALRLSENIGEDCLDIVYHSKFHHHLSEHEKDKFDDGLKKIARCVIEFDDYRGYYLPLLSMLTGWSKPVLLNGAVLSSLRDPTLEEVNGYREEGWKIKVFRLKGFVKYHEGEEDK